ncbi:MAG TPA: RDD family protein [Verrucomicrobiae bacterium]
MKFHCPTCQQKIDAPPEYAGMVISCPACQGQIQVPAAPPPPPALAINRPPSLAINRPPPPVAGATPAPLAARTAAAGATEFSNAAPLSKRIFAKIVDYLAQFGLIVIISLAWGFLAPTLFKGGLDRDTIGMIGTVVAFFTLLIPFFYNYLPLANSGATWGKSMFGLTVVRQNGQRLGYAWAVLRVLAEFVCVGACYGLALMIFIGIINAQMHHYTPPPVWQPGQPYHPPPVYSNNRTLRMFLALPVFLLMVIPYVPAFFTKGRRATHDLIVRTLVIGR